jgi:hypothetical protein
MCAPQHHHGAAIMSPDEFDAQFTALSERECFRLELLDCYNSADTRARVKRFLAGEPDDPGYRQAWDVLVREARRIGKVMSRVHVVTEPLSDYLQFEIDFYRGSVVAGEDIRILPRTQAAELDLPKFDFWLFDDAAAVMCYDEAGTWLRAEMSSTTEFVASCRRWRDTAMKDAVPLTDYIKGRGLNVNQRRAVP